MILRAIVALAALALAISGVASAQETFPNRPISLVNPFPPGGQADLTSRPLAAAMERALKQPVVIVTKQGASGAVGMQTVAVAKPDGYTLLVTVPAIATLPEVDKLFNRPPAFTRDSFVPLARVNADPVVLVVNGEQPWKSVKELVEAAKKRPNEIVFTSAGIYSGTHVPTEMFPHTAGIRMRHLPTAGGGPARSR